MRNAATVSLKSERLRANFDETMLKLFYRSALEHLVLGNFIEQPYNLKRVKHTLGLSFSDYVKKTLGGE